MRIYNGFKIPENFKEAKKISTIGYATIPYIHIQSPVGVPMNTGITFEECSNLSEEDFRDKIFEIGSKLADDYNKQYI